MCLVERQDLFLEVENKIPRISNEKKKKLMGLTLISFRHEWKVYKAEHIHKAVPIFVSQ